MNQFFQDDLSKFNSNHCTLVIGRFFDGHFSKFNSTQSIQQ